MHPRACDRGVCDDGARQFPLFRAPIRGVEHLRRGTEARHPVEQLVPLGGRGGQPLARKAHAQAVALCRINEDRGAAHLMGHAALFERIDDLAGRAAFEAGI